MSQRCAICPHGCRLEVGQTGLCGARVGTAAGVAAANYGQVTALALDPIEKKPLARFRPGSRILSVGSYGCNLRCPFCQNYAISLEFAAGEAVTFTPEELVARAGALRAQGNIGLAFTYNEPLVGYEFVADTAALAQQAGLDTVVVTNGCFCAAPFQRLLPLLSALNIDLKAFHPGFYQRIGGDLEVVKENIIAAAHQCYVEVTTLVIPGENDEPAEIAALAAWLGEVDREIPLHISRFFPRYQWERRPATSVATVYQLAEVARKYLPYVYEGNC